MGLLRNVLIYIRLAREYKRNPYMGWDDEWEGGLNAYRARRADR